MKDRFNQLFESLQYILSKGDRANYIMLSSADDDDKVKVNQYGNEYMLLAMYMTHVRHMIDLGRMNRGEVVALITNFIFGVGEDDD